MSLRSQIMAMNGVKDRSYTPRDARQTEGSVFGKGPFDSWMKEKTEGEQHLREKMGIPEEKHVGMRSLTKPGDGGSALGVGPQFVEAMKRPGKIMTAHSKFGNLSDQMRHEFGDGDAHPGLYAQARRYITEGNENGLYRFAEGLTRKQFDYVIKQLESEGDESGATAILQRAREIPESEGAFSQGQE